MYKHLETYAFFKFLTRNHATLRVREHKILGPYVEGLTKLVVSSFKVSVIMPGMGLQHNIVNEYALAFTL